MEQEITPDGMSPTIIRRDVCRLMIREKPMQHTLSNAASRQAGHTRPRLLSAACCQKLVFILAIATCSQARATAYDDCILQHIGSAQNQSAVYAIESACISKLSAPILNGPFTPVFVEVGDFSAGGLTPERGIVLKFDNDSDFDVTEVELSIRAKRSGNWIRFLVYNFQSTTPPGVFYTQACEPAKCNIIGSRKSAEVFFPLHWLPSSTAEFKARFDASLELTKGMSRK